MLARVYVTLKEGVLDPAGKAIEGGLHSLGYCGVEEVRLGKFFEVRLSQADRSQAKAQLEEMCRKLLANTVIENFRVELSE